MKKITGSFLFLGTGGSLGVPLIGCSCAICSSSSLFNKRLRSSGLLKIQGKQLLIDAGPDLRQQMLKYGITHLDGVILTHTHYDHIGGIDDIRALYFKQHQKIPCMASKQSYEEIKHRYHYLFEEPSKSEGHCKFLDFQLLDADFGSFHFLDIPFHIVTYYQSKSKVTGYRVGSFAYISDIRKYEEKVVENLQGIETLVISALRYTPSEMHFSIEEAITFSRKVEAKRIYFTHIAHELDHDITNRDLPENFSLAYDGLEIYF